MLPTIYRDTGATTILSPLTSIVYLWDEPGGDLTLLWQPENYHAHQEELPLNKVCIQCKTVVRCLMCTNMSALVISDI